MRRVARCAVVLVTAGLLALPLFSASAVVPIPVDPVETDGDGLGSWDAGVYVQPSYEGRGQEATLVSCWIHVQTTPDGVGETMTALDQSEGSHTAEVVGIFMGGESPVAGRATFEVQPGTQLTTTNTDESATGLCPGGAVIIN